MIKPVILVKF